ncbi:MAG: hydantoinase/oxoprolinase family protein [Chloroflexota bacterium]
MTGNGTSKPGAPPAATTIGWDIGGANVKAVRLSNGAVQAVQQPFAMWRERDRLSGAVAAILQQLGNGDAHAVTITAELSDAFRSKREGINFVLDAMEQAVPDAELQVFGVDGRFHGTATARREPLLVAAANWMASALLLARYCSDCLLVDVGSTTTDIIPIVNGSVQPRGRDDPSRLIHGELLYTGALRTTVCAIVQRVPLWGHWCPVAAEHFATAQDVHLLLGALPAGACTSATADGRPATTTFAAERLARVVCADTEMLNEKEIQAIAHYVATEQTRQIADAIAQVRTRENVRGPLIAAGAGQFLVRDAAEQLDLACHALSDVITPAPQAATHVDAVAPALAVATLLAEDICLTQ